MEWTHWIRDNQPLINFGLLLGAAIYTIITGFILRVSVKQARTAVQPALTLKRCPLFELDPRDPYRHFGGLEFLNSGNGAALNLVTKVAIHGAVSRFPRFDVETIRWRTAVQPGADFSIPNLHTAAEVGLGPSGHEYEVFVSYASIVGAKYLTHISIGLAGSVNSLYVGEQSLSRRARIWVGIRWRFYHQWVPIWLKVRHAGPPVQKG
jgi:hypothetical protein